MRIFFVAHRYDYGRPERGLSFEYHNFYEPLVGMGHAVSFVDLGGAHGSDGREVFNERLYEAVVTEHPDVMFTFMFRDELLPDVVRRISLSTETVTVNWFADDHWRFDDFSSHWAQQFNWVTTTDDSAVDKYRAVGQPNVIRTQWGAAHRLYRPHGLSECHGLTFVGQNYGDREAVVKRLRRAGLPVRTWGTGWGVGAWTRRVCETKGVRRIVGRRWLESRESKSRCSQAEMVEIFERSRVNLNLGAASQGGRSQIKGRVFEVPSCGGLLLTDTVPELDRYFVPDKEIVVYESIEDLVEKAGFYLGNDAARLRVRQRGLRRVLSEHTYDHRFREIFTRMGVG